MTTRIDDANRLACFDASVECFVAVNLPKSAAFPSSIDFQSSHDGDKFIFRMDPRHRAKGSSVDDDLLATHSVPFSLGTPFRPSILRAAKLTELLPLPH